MKHLLSLVALSFALVACRESAAPLPPDPTDNRMAIEISYVGAAELQVRAQPRDDAPVVTKFQNGESVSILAKQGEWAEVRTAMGSGWAKQSELTTAAEATKQEDTPEVRFVRAPMPVTAPSARGEIYIEADVNTDGDVVSTRVIANTTGQMALAEKNMASLRAAKFQPIVVRGERKAFKYDHKVTY